MTANPMIKASKEPSWAWFESRRMPIFGPFPICKADVRTVCKKYQHPVDEKYKWNTTTNQRDEREDLAHVCIIMKDGSEFWVDETVEETCIKLGIPIRGEGERDGEHGI